MVLQRLVQKIAGLGFYGIHHAVVVRRVLLIVRDRVRVLSRRLRLQ